MQQDRFAGELDFRPRRRSRTAQHRKKHGTQHGTPPESTARRSDCTAIPGGRQQVQTVDPIAGGGYTTFQWWTTVRFACLTACSRLTRLVVCWCASSSEGGFFHSSFLHWRGET